MNWGSMGCYQYPNHSTVNSQALLYRVSPTGAVSVISLHSYSSELDLTYRVVQSDLKALPDGEGGVLALWLPCHDNSSADCQTRGRYIDSNNTASAEYGLPFSLTTPLPTVSSSGHIAYYGGTNTVAFDMTTGQQLWTAAVAGLPVHAVVEGGVEVQGTTRTLLSATGAVVASGLPASRPVTSSGISRTAPGSDWVVIDVADEPLILDHTSFATQTGGGLQGGGLARGPYGIFAKGHQVSDTPYRHVAIWMVPRNQDLWTTISPHFTNSNARTQGAFFATLGAGSSQNNGASCGGKVLSAYNRDRDVNLPPYSEREFELIQYPPASEDDFITQLMLGELYFDDTALDYECLVDYNDPSSTTPADGARGFYAQPRYPGQGSLICM